MTNIEKLAQHILSKKNGDKIMETIKCCIKDSDKCNHYIELLGNYVQD